MTQTSIREIIIVERIIQDISTCRDDLIDAGRLLLPYRVSTPAGQSAVIPLGFWGVDELAHRAVVAVELGRRNLEVLAAVVELPDEVDLARVGVHLAAHFHGLLQGSSNDRHFLHLANRCDCRVGVCNGKKRREKRTVRTYM